jgi:hypothetical protein
MHTNTFARALLAGILSLAALPAGADLIRYSWSGRVEPAMGAENPWDLTGDGSAVTSSDGTRFRIEAFVDEAALDLDGTLNPDFAEFAAEEATLVIGSSKATLGFAETTFSDDAFQGLFDSVGFSTQAERLGTTLFFTAGARLPATSFELAAPGAPDEPPLFAESPPIQFGGSASPDLVTMPENAPVTAVVVPWTAFPPATPVEWSSISAGSAGDVDVTLEWLDQPSPPALEFADLSGAAFQAAPFYALTSALAYGTGSDWTVHFSEPVASLLLYTVFWRGPGGGADPVLYHFDVRPVIRSGLEGASVQADMVGFLLSLPADEFHDGVLHVPGPLTSLTVTPTNTDENGQQTLAMAVVPAFESQAVDWTAPTGTTAEGTVGSIEITIEELGATASLHAIDLTGPAFSAVPVAPDAEVLEYDTAADWTATLSEPVDGLLVYASAWRGDSAGVDPVTYRFDAPFTILSGLSTATVSEDGSVLTLPDEEFHDGILYFPGPIASLSVAGDAPSDVAQGLTFAVVGAVPEPSAALATLAAWLVLLALGRSRWRGRQASANGPSLRRRSSAVMSLRKRSFCTNTIVTMPK